MKILKNITKRSYLVFQISQQPGRFFLLALEARSDLNELPYGLWIGNYFISTSKSLDPDSKS
jgi:hypothetical protein